MKFEQFHQVLELYKTGSFSQAAKNLYMSQPNLSYSVKSLETELGIKLFTRTNEGVELTEEGRMIIDKMAIIYQNYDLLKQYCKKPAANLPLSLRVIMTNSSRAFSVFSDFCRKYENAPIRFSFTEVAELDQVIDSITTFRADLGLIGVSAPYLKSTIAKLNSCQIEHHFFPPSRLYAAIGPRNPLYHGGKALKRSDLRTMTMVSFGEGREDTSFSAACAAGLDFDVAGKLVVNSSHLFYELIEKTTAFGLIACKEDLFSQRKLWPNIRICAIEDCDCEIYTGWIKLRRLSLSDLAAELLESLKKAYHS